MDLLLDITGALGHIREEEIQKLQPAVNRAHGLLTEKKGPGSEYLGWLDLPETAPAQVPTIERAAAGIRATSKALVVIGIGGSYLGARAAIEALGASFPHQKSGSVQVFFAGHNLSSDYHADLLALLGDTDFSVNVISKSGTTTEPAIAFRLLKGLLEKKHGKEGAKKRIYATTGSFGALRDLARQEDYATFTIPEDVGGRYSVLTPVGLLPIAVAGLDIGDLLLGALHCLEASRNPDLACNPCYMYGAVRNLLLQKGLAVELLVGYEPGLQYFLEWWKQLFGESEGKDCKGLFPASATFSTDLHSLGQFIQEGTKLLFETVLRIAKPRTVLPIPGDTADLDGLNYLVGKGLDFVNDCAYRGTLKAHTEEGKVPNLVVTLPQLTARTLGSLFYFMERACALSGYLLGVNPFDQPGVEAYKKNMFTLLGKK